MPKYQAADHIGNSVIDFDERVERTAYICEKHLFECEMREKEQQQKATQFKYIFLTMGIQLLLYNPHRHVVLKWVNFCTTYLAIVWSISSDLLGGLINCNKIRVRLYY